MRSRRSSLCSGPRREFHCEDLPVVDSEYTTFAEVIGASEILIDVFFAPV